jgi:FkbM family methyltransferase
MNLRTRIRKKIQYELKKRLGIDLSTPKVYRPPLDVMVNMDTLGTEYGNWSFCTDGLNSNSVVYSFGVGEDISWDTAIIERYQVQVHAFDPTPKSIAWVQQQNTPPQFHFYGYGIADHDGVLQFYPPEDAAHVSYTVLHKAQTAAKMVELPVKQLATIMRELGHEHIDMLKMDIEGAEYRVLDNILKSGLAITQILVEFHPHIAPMTVKDTIAAVKKLQQHGYKLFAISDSGEEFSFIKR